MITPPTQSLMGCRADFEELEMTGEEAYESPSLGGRTFIRVAPNGQRVLMFAGYFTSHGREDHTLTDLAEELLHAVGAAEGDHAVIGLGEIPDGLLAEMDKLTDGKVTFTALVHREMSEEEKAVPLPEPEPAVTLTLVMSEEDFWRLGNNSCQWAASGITDQIEDRFVTMGGDEEVRETWKIAYFYEHWFEVVLARSFLDAKGYPYQVISDEADGDYAIITDFMTASWKQIVEREEIRATQKDEQFRGLLES